MKETDSQKIMFDDYELEIAMVTYNRADFVEDWMDHCYLPARERNIRLSIYDSSTNDDTENYIRHFSEKHGADIKYNRVDSEIEIGYKPMLPLLKSDSKYVWVSGDSRYHDFSVLDQKVFKYIKQNIDYIIFHVVNNEENDGKLYEDLNVFLRECFISMTCIGLSVYKTELFAPLKTDKRWIEICDRKYKQNYAFAWIGYFLEMFQMEKRRGVFTVIPILEILPEKKKQTWFKRFYGCWCEDLCNLLDAIPDSYGNVDQVLRETWKYMGLDSANYCYQTRRQGDLNVETYARYRDNGMLARVTRQLRRMETFATVPMEELEECLQRELEEETNEFYRHCELAVPRIRQMAGIREISIYGAGRGGRIVKRCFEENGISVKCFYDRRAGSFQEWEGLPVRGLEQLDIHGEFVVISMMGCTGFVVSSLKSRGMPNGTMYYPAMD